MSDLSSTTERLTADWIEKFEMDKAPATLWKKLVEEELAEFLKEAADLIWVIRGLQFAQEREGKASEAHYTAMDADIIGTHLGDLFGYDTITKTFEEVYRSNMSKLGDDGLPVRREDGKILKGPHYSSANITPVAKEFLRHRD